MGISVFLHLWHLQLCKHICYNNCRISYKKWEKIKHNPHTHKYSDHFLHAKLYIAIKWMYITATHFKTYILDYVSPLIDYFVVAWLPLLMAYWKLGFSSPPTYGGHHIFLTLVLMRYWKESFIWRPKELTWLSLLWIFLRVSWLSA